MCRVLRERLHYKTRQMCNIFVVFNHEVSVELSICLAVPGVKPYQKLALYLRRLLNKVLYFRKRFQFVPPVDAPAEWLWFLHCSCYSIHFSS